MCTSSGKIAVPDMPAAAVDQFWQLLPSEFPAYRPSFEVPSVRRMVEVPFSKALMSSQAPAVGTGVAELDRKYSAEWHRWLPGKDAAHRAWSWKRLPGAPLVAVAVNPANTAASSP